MFVCASRCCCLLHGRKGREGKGRRFNGADLSEFVLKALFFVVTCCLARQMATFMQAGLGAAYDSAGLGHGDGIHAVLRGLLLDSGENGHAAGGDSSLAGSKSDAKVAKARSHRGVCTHSRPRDSLWWGGWNCRTFWKRRGVCMFSRRTRNAPTHRQSGNRPNPPLSVSRHGYR